MLIIFSGLPATGKTTIAKQVAKHLKAVYLRIDTIEQALKNSPYSAQNFVGPEGYVISYAIAKENLALGQTVVADSVNPIAITRKEWRAVADSLHLKFLEVEIFCSDKKIHKQRVESRVPDITGHQLPSWEEIVSREYEAWESLILRIDTTYYSADEAVQKILSNLINP